jgi:2-haloacid dehalogenase/putative hydrolase of the HAD superfamily
VIDDHGLSVNAAELAAQWGDYYFDALRAADGNGFRLLVEIERDTLVETLMPYAGRIDVTPYIEQLNDYLAQPPLFEEVREVLDALTIPVCIVSNADERELRAAITHHQLAMDYVVTSESARSYKPEPGIFAFALELTGWSAGKVLHVGDSLHSDVGGAHRAGIRAAWINRSDRIKDIGTEQPDIIWTDLKPLLELQGG